jgi:hypothetical protein
LAETQNSVEENIYEQKLLTGTSNQDPSKNVTKSSQKGLLEFLTTSSYKSLLGAS